MKSNGMRTLGFLIIVAVILLPLRLQVFIDAKPMPGSTGGIDPLTYGGSFSLERILGTMPVEADGSAHFEAPANRSLFLIALLVSAHQSSEIVPVTDNHC